MEKGNFAICRVKRKNKHLSFIIPSCAWIIIRSWKARVFIKQGYEKWGIILRSLRENENS
ncbi:hypothetical protein BCY86_06070 [Pajaroellobacter abortibovis]|uniref:Uncharacterized protein n=1 Tax=Pajaroellobacter abortibovis TaxID=1882918 RepID=A0A1L6MY17_9BACT|nr:hypothetical protein BCY86_06070 [Pajaroellobacter abortibovis]